MKKIKVHVKGLGDFESLEAAAKGIGCNVVTVIRARKKGRPLHEIKPKAHKKGIYLEGYGYFESIRQGAKAMGVCPSQLTKAYNNGRLDKVGTGNPIAINKPVKIRFTQYESRRAACNDLKVCYKTIREAEKAGKRGLDLVGLKNKNGNRKKRGTVVSYFNTIYPSMKALADETGHSISRIQRFVDEGIPLERLIHKHKYRKGHFVTYHGKTYPSQRMLSDMLGKHPSFVNRACKYAEENGVSLEYAIDRKIRQENKHVKKEFVPKHVTYLKFYGGKLKSGKYLSEVTELSLYILDCVHKRARKRNLPVGYFVNTSKTQYGNKVMFYNREFPSYKALAAVVDVCSHTVARKDKENDINSILKYDSDYNLFRENMKRLDEVVEKNWQAYLANLKKVDTIHADKLDNILDEQWQFYLENLKKINWDKEVGIYEVG